MKPLRNADLRQTKEALLLAGIVQAISLLGLPEAAIAKDGCFCLRGSGENLLVVCKKEESKGRAGEKRGEKTLCFDKGKNDWVTVNTTGWTEIQKAGCKKCEIPEDGDFVIRGGEEEE